MISRLEILLDENAELNYQSGPLLHGALMELLPEEVAEELHRPQVHPYSQYLEKKEGRWRWIVTALTDELSRELISETLLLKESVELKKTEQVIYFDEKRLTQIPMKTFAERMYRGEAGKYIQIEFLTPVSFKQEGKYLFYPDIRGMYISLLNKYAAAEPSQNMRDEDFLEELVCRTQIVRYRLHSISFQVGNARIPAFMGNVTLRIDGTQTLRNFADFLFHFGEYSGIGIKGALGMGANRIVDEKRTGVQEKWKSADAGDRKSMQNEK